MLMIVLKSCHNYLQHSAACIGIANQLEVKIWFSFHLYPLGLVKVLLKKVI